MYNFLGNHHREALWYTKNMTKPKHILTNICTYAMAIKAHCSTARDFCACGKLAIMAT